MIADYKSTIAGAGLAVTTAIVGVVNYEQLSFKQLLIIGCVSLSQFLFGLWAKDRV